MSIDKNLPRQTSFVVTCEGVDITESVKQYLISLDYTDNQEDECDDLQIKLQDRDRLWTTKWLNDMIEVAATLKSPKKAETKTTTEAADTTIKVGDIVQFTGNTHYRSSNAASGYSATPGPAKVYIIYNGKHPYSIIHTDSTSNVYGWVDAQDITKNGTASASSTTAVSTDTGKAQTAAEKQAEENRNKMTGLKITAKIIRHNWTAPGKDDVLSCGEFELDSVDISGPPGVVIIKATSLSYNRPIRQTKRSQAWENYHLSGIANEMAVKNGMSCQYLSGTNPYYEREEQDKTSDIDFLSGLCHKAGLSLKCTNNTLVIFSQKTEEAKDAVRTFTHGDGTYTKWKLNVGSADTNYNYCRVSYVTKAGKLIEGYAYASDYTEPEEDEEDTNQLLEVYVPCSSIAEAQELAQKYLRLHNKYARTCNFTVAGDPNMVAGVNIQLKSWGGFDGKYSITSAKHTVNSSGYQCTLSGRRILDEAKIPAASTAETAEDTAAIQKGDKVRVQQGAKTYSGTSKLQSWCYSYTFDVIQVGGQNLSADRVVIGIGQAVTAAMNVKDLYKV
jgi:phage protein D